MLEDFFFVLEKSFVYDVGMNKADHGDCLSPSASDVIEKVVINKHAT